MCTLARSRPTAARAPSRESGILFVPDIHESIIILRILVGFTGAQQEGGFIDQDSTIILRRSSNGSIHSGQGTRLGSLSEH